MPKLSRQHNSLLVVFLLTVILLTGAHFLFIRPLAIKVSDDDIYIDENRNKLQKSGWPLDPERLHKLLELKNNRLNSSSSSGNLKQVSGVKEKSVLMLRKYTGVFTPRIKKIFSNPADFTKEVSRLDYQEEYNELEHKLARKGVFLSEKILNLGENTASPFIYQMVLQVWLLDSLAGQIFSNRLRFVNDENILAKDERGGRRAAARIQFLPIRSYYLEAGDPEAYVLELPVRMALRGTLDNLNNFLAGLQENGCFFPVSHLQVLGIPELREGGKTITMQTGNLEIEVECSLFFRRPDDGPTVKEPVEIKVLPTGA